MVRTFPRTTRARAAAVLLAGGLLLSGVTPLAQAADHKKPGHKSGHAAKPSPGDLKAKKQQVEKRLAGVSNDLDESSAQLRAATAALAAAQTQLSSAQAHLADTRGQLAAAEVLDKQMAAKLVAAKDRLAEARANLAEGRDKITQEQDQLGQIVVSNYQTGDPSLMGLSMVLTTQDPTELTGQLNSVQNVMDKESVVLSRLEATKALLMVQEREVATAKAGVAKQRRAAAANLLRKQGLESEAEAAEATVHNLVDARAKARHGGRERARRRPGAAAQPADREVPHRRHPEASRRRGPRPCRRCGRRGRWLRHDPRRRGTGRLQRLPQLPGPRRRHLAVRLADPPHLRLPLAARRRRLRRRLRHPDPRRGRRHRRRALLPDRLGQPGHHRPRLPPRRRPRHHHQPHERSRDRRPRPARQPRPDRRVRRLHRLVHRLPPALHRDAERVAA